MVIQGAMQSTSIISGSVPKCGGNLQAMGGLVGVD